MTVVIDQEWSSIVACCARELAQAAKDLKDLQTALVPPRFNESDQLVRFQKLDETTQLCALIATALSQYGPEPPNLDDLRPQNLRDRLTGKPRSTAPQDIVLF